jgi:hypothetical protein
MVAARVISRRNWHVTRIPNDQPRSGKNALIRNDWGRANDAWHRPLGDNDANRRRDILPVNAALLAFVSLGWNVIVSGED